jgi:diadenosine tetraphosphate (Ap4A) HIT family hydrolase
VSETPRPLPGFATWPTFPFAGDLQLKKLEDPVPVEPPRHGEDPAECRACSARDEAYIWVSERWRVRSLERPTGLPMVLILESRSHLDLGDLPNMLAAELGLMTVRLERAIRSLDDVARVHVNRWGDGSAHLHLWFLARPYGRLQLRGTFLSLWDDILPAIPERQWRENLALVAEWLAGFDGRALAEPPRIDWKAPANFAPDAPFAEADEDPSATGAPDATAVSGGVLDAANDSPAYDGTAYDGTAYDGTAYDGTSSASATNATDMKDGRSPSDRAAGVGRSTDSGAGTGNGPAASAARSNAPDDERTRDTVAESTRNEADDDTDPAPAAGTATDRSTGRGASEDGTGTGNEDGTGTGNEDGTGTGNRDTAAASA